MSIAREETTSNLRPISILAFYLLFTSSLSSLIVYSLNLGTKTAVRSRPSQKRTQLFGLITVACLAITWYYMLSFFALSYRAWAYSHEVALPEGLLGVQGLFAGGDGHVRLALGQWLKDSQLFREAWETAVETPSRFWWTQQIFFITSAWSVFLSREGSRYKVPHLWAYMLVGQFVAISFAMNLFYLAIVRRSTPISQRGRTSYQASRDKSMKGQSKSMWTPSAWLYTLPLMIVFGATALIPYASNTSIFLTVLATPHIILLIPPMYPYLIHGDFGIYQESKASFDRYYARIFMMIIVFSVVLQTKATFDLRHESPGSVKHRFQVEVYQAEQIAVYGQDWSSIGLLGALRQHPAISSVGWDVILCWISSIAWALTREWR